MRLVRRITYPQSTVVRGTWYPKRGVAGEQSVPEVRNTRYGDSWLRAEGHEDEKEEDGKRKQKRGGAASPAASAYHATKFLIPRESKDWESPMLLPCPSARGNSRLTRLMNSWAM